MASDILTEVSYNLIIPERVTNLIVQYADLIYCPICSYILWKPVTCSSCENSFCFHCIQTWLFEQQEQLIESIDDENDLSKSLSLARCPFNCSPYISRKCPSLLLSILSKLTIECRNKVYGCKEILFYEQLEKHEEELCPYQIVRCSGCQQNFPREIFEKDEHLSTCLDIELQCVKCGSIFQRKDKHDDMDCMKQQICSLKQDLSTFQQKSANVYQIQRERLDIMGEKLSIIEEIWCTDNDNDDDQYTNEMNTPAETSNESTVPWNIIIGVEIISLFVFTSLTSIPAFL